MPALKSSNAAQGVQLTRHFMLSELIESQYAERHGISNVPNSPTVMVNLAKLAQLLEDVRAACAHKPVVVTSAYRCPAVNTGIGGSPKSEHLVGAAADIKVPGFGTPLQVARAIVAAKIPFGQLLMEGSWVHVSLPDGERDGQILTAHFVAQPGGRARVHYTAGLPA